MKKFEIKSIGAGSVFRFYFALGVVIGLIGSVIVLAAGASPADIGLDLGFIKSLHGVFFSIVTAIVCSLVYGLVCGVGGAIASFIYNIFAAAVGGVSIRLVDKE